MLLNPMYARKIAPPPAPAPPPYQPREQQQQRGGPQSRAPPRPGGPRSSDDGDDPAVAPVEVDSSPEGRRKKTFGKDAKPANIANKQYDDGPRGKKVIKEKRGGGRWADQSDRAATARAPRKKGAKGKRAKVAEVVDTGP